MSGPAGVEGPAGPAGIRGQTGETAPQAQSWSVVPAQRVLPVPRARKE